ncbi:MAG: capsular biosynthesis protein [Rhodobacteraceae bacterium]|nr:capsular biosynthesis protein [Paracoccaceae bacterium]
MKYTYLKDGDPEIDAMLASVCALGGDVAHLTDASLRFSGYPETKARVDQSLATAKRPPRNGLVRTLKRALYGVQYNAFRKYFDDNPDAVAVSWNGIKGTRRAFMGAARDAGRPTVFLERAPLPGRVTVDSAGVNQENSLPRDAAFYLDWASQDPDRQGRGWMALKQKLVARAPKRGDVTQGAASDDLAATPFVFCPLQVPDDTQIRQFSGWVGPIESYLAHLSDAVPALPEGWHLRLKEHPSSRIPLGHLLAAMTNRHGDRVVIDNRTDTFHQVDSARAVVTLNSSVGLQAFFFDKPVIVLGQAFFRIPGLVTPVDGQPELAQSFADADRIGFDAALRNAFMNYLDQVYYPSVEPGPDGRPQVVPDLVRPKLPTPAVR